MVRAKKDIHSAISMFNLLKHDYFFELTADYKKISLGWFHVMFWAL